MTFGNRDVVRNWGKEGLAIVTDLAEHNGYERLPDPVNGETLADYVTRCARSGLCYVAGDMHVLQDVQARKKAEARGLPVYELDAIEPHFVGEHLRELPINERFEVYKTASITPVEPLPEWARASQLRGTDVPLSPGAAARFESYQRDKNTPDTTVSDFQEE
ncbi:MAG TPA: hypothetical protein VIV83_07515 [Gemmatimonadales bacterium]|jgi:hypothetical protein